MKQLRKLNVYFMIILLAGIGLMSCEDDDTPKDLSPTEAKEVLRDMDTYMETDFTAMYNTEGFEAIEFLSMMEDPFATTKSNKTNNSIFPQLKESVVPFQQNQLKTEGEDPFPFTQLVGTYSWNIQYQMWDVQHGVPSDKIIIEFPTDTLQTENNAILTLHEYSEQAISGDGYTYYEPTRLNTDLYINDIKYVGLDLTASYAANGQPTSVDASIYLVPFQFDISMTDGATSSTVSAAILFEEATIFSIGLNVNFANSTKLEVQDFDGHLRYRDVKVHGSIDFYDLMQIDETSATTYEEVLVLINEEIDVRVTQVSTGDKIADVELGFIGIDEEQEFTIILVFSDGTTEPAEPYFETFMENIEGLLENIGLTLDINFAGF